MQKRMRQSRRMALLLALLLLAAAMLPAGAGAASVRFPIQVGFLHVGDSMALFPALSGVSLNELYWASTDERVVRMDGNRLTAAGEGIALIGARGGGAWDVCGAVVLPRTLSLSVGERHALPANGLLEYASADSGVAAVDASGAVTAVAAGETLVGVRFGAAYGIVRVTVTGESQRCLISRTVAPRRSSTAPMRPLDRSLVYYRRIARHGQLPREDRRRRTQLYETYGYVGRNGIDKTREGDGRRPPAPTT